MMNEVNASFFTHYTKETMKNVLHLDSAMINVKQ